MDISPYWDWPCSEQLAGGRLFQVEDIAGSFLYQIGWSLALTLAELLVSLLAYDLISNHAFGFPLGSVSEETIPIPWARLSQLVGQFSIASAQSLV